MADQVAIVRGGEQALLMVRPGQLDEGAWIAFQNGQCHAFAIAMHEHTGWPIRAVIDESDGQPNHLYVLDEDGQGWDICGHMSEERLAAEWHGECMDFSADGARALGDHWAWRAAQVDVAATLVEPLLAQPDWLARTGRKAGHERCSDLEFNRWRDKTEQFLMERAGIEQTPSLLADGKTSLRAAQPALSSLEQAPEPASASVEQPTLSI